MSGPNTDYDPVEVTPLKADEVERMRDDALAAIAAAATLDELKTLRADHAGDRSPLALANREIGSLPPQARKEAGMRVGQARGAVNKALAERLAAARGRARGAHARRGDRRRHPADRPRPPRVASPDHADVGAGRRRLRRDGLGGRRGAGHRGRVAQLRRPQPRSRPPGADHAGHLLDRAGRERHGPAHPHLAGAGPHHAHPGATDLRRRAPGGSSAPTSTTPRTARCSTRSRGWPSTRASPWPT